MLKQGLKQEDVFESKNQIELEELIKRFDEKTLKACEEITVSDPIFDGIEIKKYIPFEVKEAVCKVVVKNTIVINKGIPQLDTAGKYIAHIMSVVGLYTNIELKNGQQRKQYDELRKRGLVKVIIGMIDQDELKEYNFIFDSIYNDFFDNMTSTHFFVACQVERFGGICSDGLLKLSDAIGKFDFEKAFKKDIIKNKVKEFTGSTKKSK